MEKDNIQNLLIEVGRKLIREKGTEALTVRKLSEASGCSVGAIYNQFSNMDNFIIVQNFMTLEALEKEVLQVPQTDDGFVYLNNLFEKFADYVLENKNLWYMLYYFHLTHGKHLYSNYYLRKVVGILRLVRQALERAVPNMERPELLLSSQVLWLSVFALSAFLTKEVLDTLSKIDKSAICQIMVNTFVVGLTVLEKRA